VSRLVDRGSELYGYSEGEVRQVMDHRAIRVLEDAIAYRELQSAKSKTQEKVKQSKVTKTKAKRRQDPKRKQMQQQRQRLKRSGSIDDAIALMLNS